MLAHLQKLSSQRRPPVWSELSGQQSRNKSRGVFGEDEISHSMCSQRPSPRFIRHRVIWNVIQGWLSLWWVESKLIMWCLTALQDNTDEFCSYQHYVFGALRQLLFLKHSPVPRDNLFHRSLPRAQISMWLQWSFNHAKVTYGYPHWDFRVRPAETLRYCQGRSNKTHCVCAKTCLSVRAPSTKIKTGSLFRCPVHDEMSA